MIAKMNPNSEAVYDSQIAPLMEQIIAVCKANQIPMFATFQYAGDEDTRDFCTTRIPFAGESPVFEAVTRMVYGEGRMAAFRFQPG